MGEIERNGGGGRQRARDAAPSMAAVRRTRGRRETRVLEDRSGVVLEGSRCRESERRAPGGLIIGEAEICPTWRSLSGRGARRERPAGIRQEKEAVLRQRVCEGGAQS
jgi:hypothetical protein